MERLERFDEYWPEYLNRHRSRWNRAAHVGGLLGAAAIFGWGVVRRNRAMVLASPLAWSAGAALGHLMEGNRPDLDHPWFSMMGDLRMTRLVLTGELGAELAHHGVDL